MIEKAKMGIVLELKHFGKHGELKEERTYKDGKLTDEKKYKDGKEVDK